MIAKAKSGAEWIGFAFAIVIVYLPLFLFTAVLASPLFGLHFLAARIAKQPSFMGYVVGYFLVGLLVLAALAAVVTAVLAFLAYVVLPVLGIFGFLRLVLFFSEQKRAA